MQPWGPTKPPECKVVLGLPGSGKTRFAKAETAEAWRVVYVSPTTDYRAPGRLTLSAETLQRYPKLLEDPHCRLNVELDEDPGAEAVTALRVIKSSGGRLVVVLDEVGDYRKPAEQAINTFARKLRHYQCVLYLVSQVTTDIPLTSRKVATHAVVFGQQHPKELLELRSTYNAQVAADAEAWCTGDPPAMWTLKAAQSRKARQLRSGS